MELRRHAKKPNLTAFHWNSLDTKSPWLMIPPDRLGRGFVLCLACHLSVMVHECMSQHAFGADTYIFLGINSLETGTAICHLWKTMISTCRRPCYHNKNTPLVLSFTTIPYTLMKSISKFK